MNEIGFDFDNHDLGIDGSPDDVAVECDECGEEIVEDVTEYLVDGERVCKECFDEISKVGGFDCVERVIDPMCKCGFPKHSHHRYSNICPVLVRGMLSMFQKGETE